MALNAPKSLPKAPITSILIEPMRLVAQFIPEESRAMYEDAYRAALDQQTLLNDKLNAIQKMLSEGGVVLRSELNTLIINILPVPTTDSVIYDLPIVGPSASISGTTYLALTSPVTVAAHTGNLALGFYWTADDPSATARWRLRNVTSSTTLMSGTAASPFARTLVTSSAAGVPLSGGDEVSLEFSYSSAAGGGEIEMDGAGSLEVS